MNDKKLEEAIEGLVDLSNVTRVLGSLEAVCYAKAEHIEETWQDRQLAAVWRRGARAVGAAAARVGKLLI